MVARRKPGFFTQRREGWGMGLYRNRNEGWFAGVCAGLADYWNVPNWMVRCIAVALFFISGTLALWGYIAAIFLIATPRSAREEPGAAASESGEGCVVEVTETVTNDRPARSSRRSAASDRLRAAEARLDAAMARMDRMGRSAAS